jgi:uncharacterized protein (TIGR00730 family)
VEVEFMKVLKKGCVEMNMGLLDLGKDFLTAEKALALPGKKVAFFGGSKASKSGYYYEKAKQLAEIIANAGVSVITGGGTGIMEASNLGAYSINPEKSYGLTTSCISNETKNDFVSDDCHMVFNTLSMQLLALISCCDSVVFFPGGYGTLEELASIAVRIKLSLINKVPVYFFDNKFWGGLVSWFSGSVFEEGLVTEDELSFFLVEDGIEVIAEKILSSLEEE